MPSTAAPTTAELAPEWRRVELLAGCLLGGRRGESPPADVLAELAEVQEAVRGLREQDAWKGLSGGGLDDLEHDLLAVAVAVALFPRTQALLANVTGGSDTSTPTGGYAPTAALVAELLSLRAEEIPSLAACLRPDGPLLRRSLVLAGGRNGAWHAPLTPGPGVVESLLGIADEVPTPPGTRRVPVGDVTFDDLVLTDAVRRRLEEFRDAVANRDRVGAWGMGRRGGPVAMLSGPSGVGKSLAARALAAELDRPLFVVDLGSLVSKYIGETEKNLNLLFDATEGARVLLHFEEAESLFGRRGEIREARDRYANLEVSHLLSRLEQHDGPCVLSTNLRRNVDPAFIRRFTSVVEMGRPDAAMRAELWRRHLPMAEAADIDLSTLASVDLTGGQIHNAAVYACLVAGDPDPARVTLQAVTLGVWRELTKASRQVLPTDLGALAPHLDPTVLHGEVTS